MCDPLSAVGSVLALAGFAGESCDHLCKYFRSYSEASEDIRHHISSLQALQTTFTSIAAIEKDLPKGFIIPPRFGARLQECASDLAATDKFIAFSQTRLQNRKIQRTWAKLRWASPDQKHKLQTMLGRIEAHHRNFSLDLLVLNIQLGLHPKDETKMACSDGQIEMVKLLINEGLNINEFNDAGQNPSHFALRFGSKDEICRLLMDRGAELDHRSIAGEQPFHTFHSSALEQTINRHRYLTDFWNPDWRGMTILHWMAWSSKSSGAFLESFGSQAKAQVSVADHDGRTMLHLAAQRGNIDVINYIFRAKPDFYVDFPDSTGRTPLFYATHSKRSPQTIRSLVARGANLWAEDCHGNTLFHAAAAQNNFEAVDTLVELGVGRLLWKRSGARELTAAEYASWQTRHALAGYLERLLLEQDEMIPETPIQQGCSSEALCDSCQDVERRTITTEQLDLKVSALGKLAYLLESVNHLCKFILKSCPSQNLLCASVLALIAWMICLSTR
ncbi:uncharacterized protein KY384_006819 [Bacidia gigantensis]|uniref:uncharacterized protein n=1 Tax=Bacidia gigantensis TaxID=2732470 RepID=UPI001D0439FA|nr:uncharacterized protein KY384_006819 [Bacidia gigantensis]KAG8527903.1 hypothetical protein KY384_006819 [Bacidia gigantensis]